MLLDEKIKDLQIKTRQKITYEQVAPVLGLGSKQAAQNRVTRKQELKEWEIKALEEHFLKKKVNNYNHNDNNTNYITLTYRPDVYLSAGYGIDVLDERAETMLIDACLLVSERGIKYNHKQCEIVRISGNSMSPEYRHGDRVIINKDDTELMDGHIFAFRYKNQCYVKEINLMGDRVKCISLNKEYEPFYIEKGEDFTVLGRILPRIRL